MQVLEQLIGSWTGTVSTWLKPDLPAETSEIAGSFRSLLDGGSVIHEYTSRVGSHRSDGFAVIGRDLSSGLVSMTWCDTFHTTSELMVLTSAAKDPDHLSLSGSYSAGAETWGWRVEFGIPERDRLLIAHFNILPSGVEVPAVEVRYER